MAAFQRMLAVGFWVLGLLTTAVAVVGRIIRPLRLMMEERIEFRSLLWLAAVFFLGAVATWAVSRTTEK